MYNHPIYLAETFVDPQYFKGTCYKAQGWEFLGYTRGFAKCANRYYPHNQPTLKQDVEDLGLISFSPSAPNHRQTSRTT
ncbi:MAG: DUF4338 domain-containing protein [Candidatus Brocadia sp.]|nr:DUF4338 domain-containing protein [Candidatus Brocadia sp.]MDG6025945.1 DUF4338 domain-containing protein [Candidatus Brocadia sp.]